MMFLTTDWILFAHAIEWEIRCGRHLVRQRGWL